jgi:hypothetical protein
MLQEIQTIQEVAKWSVRFLRALIKVGQNIREVSGGELPAFSFVRQFPEFAMKQTSIEKPKTHHQEEPAAKPSSIFSHSKNQLPRFQKLMRILLKMLQA